jgi:hypothetical protein
MCDPARCISQVRDTAAEALAVMHARIGYAELNALLAVHLVDVEMYHKLQARFALNALPKISADGLVLHAPKSGSKMGLQVDISHVDDGGVRRTTPATTPSAKIPWDLPR